MIAVLSPAKSLNTDIKVNGFYTQARLEETPQKLVSILSKRSKKDIMDLMSVSENIAELNVDRFAKWQSDHTKVNSTAAIHTFKGDVYQGMEIDDFDESDLKIAQDKIRILSGLYGLLRPMDLMQPYRLEMGTRLTYYSKKNLYDFWDTQITDLLNEDLEAGDHQALINLASQEYFKSIKTKLVKVPIVNIHFKEWRDDELKIISFNAKRARGMMARYIVKNRLSKLEDLKGFDLDDYGYDEERSDDKNYLFTR